MNQLCHEFISSVWLKPSSLWVNVRGTFIQPNWNGPQKTSKGSHIMNISVKNIFHGNLVTINC